MLKSSLHKESSDAIQLIHERGVKGVRIRKRLNVLAMAYYDVTVQDVNPNTSGTLSTCMDGKKQVNSKLEKSRSTKW